jgi:hypothetical protein
MAPKAQEVGSPEQNDNSNLGFSHQQRKNKVSLRARALCFMALRQRRKARQSGPAMHLAKSEKRTLARVLRTPVTLSTARRHDLPLTASPIAASQSGRRRSR